MPAFDEIGALVRSGTIVDVALALLVLEAAVLIALGRRGAGVAGTGELLAHLAAGAFLLLALRSALTGADWRIIAGCLVGALVAHAIDLRLRLRRA